MEKEKSPAKVIRLSPWAFELSSRLKGRVRLHPFLNSAPPQGPGPWAEAMVWPADLEDLCRAIRFAEARHIPWVVLGSGTHVGIQGENFHGIAINLSPTFSQLEFLGENRGEAYLEFGAGVPVPLMGDIFRRLGLRGTEALENCSGTLGAAICRNAGRWEDERDESLEAISVLLIGNYLEVELLPRQEWTFRDGTFHFPKRAVVLGGRFRLPKKSADSIQPLVRHWRKFLPLLASLGPVFGNGGIKNFSVFLPQDTAQPRRDGLGIFKLARWGSGSPVSWH